ncbi:MAG: hypothetical protein ACE37J_01875 [Pikeienuella sp.]|uniref:hypothetical protein n=1 Tax=Pikeienuella sp. TaxID=2831957 RepID=UPI00391B3E8B
MRHPQGFGREFGDLVKARRRERGLSRPELAAMAFGGPGAARRVAEIEDGLVSSPAPRVVEAIRHALGLAPSDLPGAETEPPGAAPLRQMLEASLRTLDSRERDLRDAAIRLKTLEWRASRARLAGIVRNRPDVQPFATAAQAAIDRGDFAEAEARLSAAEAEVGRGPARIELRRERGEVALMSGAPGLAATLAESAAGFLDPFVPDAAADLRQAFAAALHRHGRLFGADAIAAAGPFLRRNLDYWRKNRRPEKWATTRNNLANALHDLAIMHPHEASVALLEEAVSLYRAALEVFTERAHPGRRATTNSNLATALGNLARRKRGKEAAALHVEAAAAYRAALSARARRSKPADWAQAQAQLGLALGAAAMATPGPARARMLQEAEQAEQAALGVYSREATPAHWAAARNNLGNTLRAQAASGGGAGMLVKAVAAYRDALDALGKEDGAEEHRRAAIRCNLARALAELAEFAPKEQAAGLAAEAAASARAALAARSREREPEAWAAAHFTLVGALTAEARFSAGPSAARAASEAAALCRKALQGEAAGAPRWVDLQLALGRALEAEAKAGGPPETLRRLQAAARAAYAAALTKLDRRSPLAAAAAAARDRLAA